MIRGYHFVGETLRDGRPVPKDGEWLIFEGEPKLCRRGLHGSRHPYDALKYAPGPILCLADFDDICEETEDKFVCRRRCIVKRIDATSLLRYFARMQAVSRLNRWKETPPDVVLDWLMTGDESLRLAARNAASSAPSGRIESWRVARATADKAWIAAQVLAYKANQTKRAMFAVLVKEALGE